MEEVAKRPTQKQMFYASHRHNAELNLQFLTFVRDGLTKSELSRNIERRPELWARWSHWLDKLPG